MEWALRAGGREFAISEAVFVLGRGADAHLRLDDDSVSRRHAAFRICDEGPVLEDLRSRNGTFVNGRPVLGPARLTAGDLIALGACRLELVQMSPHPRFEPERATQPIARNPHADALTALSPREREVFAMLANGLSQREMAARLRVSIKTLETYRTRIGQKLGLRNRAELVRCALEAGILRHPDDS